MFISLPSHGALLPPASLVTIPLVAGPSVRWSRPSPTQFNVVPSTLVSQPGTGLHIRLDTPTYCGLSLSPAMEPFPRKLVEKVRSGQFVEMRVLLHDNISLLGQLETLVVSLALLVLQSHV